MNNLHLGARFRCREAEQVVGHLAFLDLAHGRPARPQAREESQRAGLVKRKPHRRARAVGQDLLLRERRQRDDAAALDAEPSRPMRRRNIADVGHARIALAAFQREERRRHAPARHDKLSAVGSVAEDRRQIIGKHTRQRRHVANVAQPRSRKVANRLRSLGEAVEIAHEASGCLDVT
jgi:hypothetical protein